MRKTISVTIAADGRDQGKVFVVREMSASAAEKWAARLFLALANAGAEIPEGIAGAGLAGVAAMGLRALGGLTFAAAEPLLDEMFSCIATIPDPTRPDVVRPLVENDIEEVATRLRLRMEVIELHLGFSIAGALSMLKQMVSAPSDSPATQTSPAP